MTNKQRKQRKERFHKIEICDQMQKEVINLKSNSLAMKLAKNKDLKEIRKIKQELIKQRFRNDG